MRIGFIGAGRVGFTMGKYLKLHGEDITGYYSRKPEHAREAADFTDTFFYNDVQKLIETSDAIILTVSDSAIKTVFDSIKTYPGIAEKTLCHTSGSMSSDVFDDSPFQVYGYSIHPIYAISDKYASYKDFSNAFITIEGHEKHLDELESIFKSAGNKTGRLKSEDKSKLMDTPDGFTSDIDNYLSSASKDSSKEETNEYQLGTTSTMQRGKNESETNDNGTTHEQHNLRRYGNIGVQTAAQILGGYREAAVFDAYESVIFPEVSQLFLSVVDLDEDELY